MEFIILFAAGTLVLSLGILFASVENNRDSFDDRWRNGETFCDCSNSDEDNNGYCIDCGGIATPYWWSPPRN